MAVQPPNECHLSCSKRALRFFIGTFWLLVIISFLFALSERSFRTRSTCGSSPSSKACVEHAAANDNKKTTMELATTFRPRMSSTEKAVALHSLKSLAAKLQDVNVTYFLYGGTLLGARRHRGIIPWDDDVDILANYTQLKEMETALRSLSDFDLYTGNANRYKLYPRNGSAISGKNWKWPYIDICFFSENSTHVYDKYPGLEKTYIYAKADVFPLVYRPFDDLILPSPADEERVLARNYDLQTCATSCYSHKAEAAMKCNEVKSVPCSQLYAVHPFIFRNSSHPPIWEVLRVDNMTLREYIIT